MLPCLIANPEGSLCQSQTTTQEKVRYFFFSAKSISVSSLNCPYCQQELAVGAAECPKCQLNLNRIHEKLSPVPILRSGLNDTSELLTPRQRESLNKSLDHFSKNLVQSHIHILIRQFSPEFPLSSHLFWIFNRHFNRFGSCAKTARSHLGLRLRSLLRPHPSTRNISTSPGGTRRKQLSQSLRNSRRTPSPTSSKQRNLLNWRDCASFTNARLLGMMFSGKGL